MEQASILAMSGCLVLGFILGIGIYPRVLAWARSLLPDFRWGECSNCGLTAYVTQCGRCGKAVAFCHYYGILGTDVPNRDKKRRSAHLCTKCLTPEETNNLERLLGRSSKNP